jgi:hypothetical protein
MANGDKKKGKGIGGLSKVPNNKKSPDTVMPCKVKPNVLLHTVVVRARWQDTRADVDAVKCQILLGTGVIHPGPLANGTLGKGGIEGGAYEITLPEVDSEEWDVE